MRKSHKSHLESFWYRAGKRDEGCWLWTGAANTANGYGVLRVDGKTVTAHRYSWILHNGPVPSGLQICHKCDVRRCCNPDHLFLGTQLDNMHDMAAKGRKLVGEKHGNAILTEAQVLEIRRLGDARIIPQTQIAAQFGVTRSAITGIVTRRLWNYLA